MRTYTLARMHNTAYSPTDITVMLKGEDEPSSIAMESVVDADGNLDWLALEVDGLGNRWFTTLELDHLGYTRKNQLK